MSSDRWERLQSLFDRAVEMAPEARAEFLDRECGHDPDLRRECEALIEQDAGRAGVLEEILGRAAVETTRVGASPAIGRRIGPWRIERELGRGGMGTVYLAARADDQYQMQVAIKLIRGGTARPELHDRFRRERQILATLDHPGIARLLDGGATEDGEPYVVMEYVEGRPIDAYCREAVLDTDERLALFRSVCDAVQYAHRNLVVHRDIKPCNILVTSDGTVKLLDFGIAKLLDSETETSPGRGTLTALRPMTPEYASPEQVRGDLITTATDVYSLGVLLYELLVGEAPYRARSGHAGELERAILEEEPERPSTAAGRLASTGSGRDSSGGDRPDPPRRLSRRLAGDLDNIVMMALRKEPSRRYASVEQLSEDLRRHLEGLPVIARPSTLAYRTRKFVSRHRVGLSTAALVLVLVGGLIGFYTARLARERETARHESAKSSRVSEFLVGMFGISDPEQGRGREITARELLDQGAAKIREELADQPEVQGALMETMGRAYMGLGLFDSALPLLEESLAVRRSLGPDHPDLGAALQGLADLNYEMGDYERALDLTRESLEVNRRVHGPRSAEVALNLNDLGWLDYARGDYDEAETLHRDALAIRRKVHGPRSPEYAESLNNLAVVIMEKGDRAGAEPLLREALDIRRENFGDDHPMVTYTLNNLAVNMEFLRRYDEAERAYREALTIDKRLHGGVHADDSTTEINLARVLRRQGALEEAETFARDAVAIDRRFRGDDHPYVAYGLNELGDILKARGDFPGAEAAFVEAIAIYRAKLSEGDLSFAGPLESYGALLTERDRSDEAEPLLREAVEVRRSALRPPHEALARAEGLLGDCLAKLGRFGEAEPLLRGSHDALLELFGDEDTRPRAAAGRLRDLYAAWERPGEARMWAARAGDPPVE